MTRIKRADTASRELNVAPISGGLQQQPLLRALPRLPDWQALRLRAASTADSACRCGRWPSQTAYPPPRESCVRGADRAAVDKRFRCALRQKAGDTWGHRGHVDFIEASGLGRVGTQRGHMGTDPPAPCHRRRLPRHRSQPCLGRCPACPRPVHCPQHPRMRQPAPWLASPPIPLTRAQVVQHRAGPCRALQKFVF